MRKTLLLATALLTATTLAAQLPPPKPGDPPSPAEIVAAAPKADWSPINRNDLMVMDLAPDARGKPRRVVIQLLPAPFSQGWIGNIRKLVAARFWDATSIYRVQDNYVVQWGDAEADDPKKAKALPTGLRQNPESEYAARFTPGMFSQRYTGWGKRDAVERSGPMMVVPASTQDSSYADAYVVNVGFAAGFPVGMSYPQRSDYADPRTAPDDDSPDLVWPVHCYGMVGVGRDMPPNTGSGAELYTVIGHAPRQLDRNIALVGRVIEGIEHMSSLPRGHGPLGIYDLSQGDERVPILAVRMGPEVTDLPSYEYLDTEKPSFARYADARANRRDPFYIRPAGGADICNIPVPVRRSTGS